MYIPTSTYTFDTDSYTMKYPIQYINSILISYTCQAQLSHNINVLVQNRI